ncbi:MbnP family copper-binding protein [Aestuariibacter salexigens]|uniref:MbnP family copper-binding protein n=1 Tax=Aestuariibacter salexigens TaxID=226010 RepID=UPI00146FAC7F|nr:MbnP family copper-binding protein [Aestuariibacter salexigens]
MSMRNIAGFHQVRYCPQIIFVSAIVIILLQGCNPFSSSTHSLAVELKYRGKPVECNASFEHDGQYWTLSQFAMYLSGISAQRQGQPVELELEENDWQQGDVVLLFGLNQCDEHAESNHVITLAGDLQQADSLTFTLGLPFNINHLNPVTQSSPLNISEMFWSWRNGYKFVRIDMRSEHKNSWSYHLGSLGCVSAASVRAPESACRYPNTFDFSVSKQSDGTKLIVHLDRLLQDVEPLKQGDCMFEGMGEPLCQILATNLSGREIFTWH